MGSKKTAESIITRMPEFTKKIITNRQNLAVAAVAVIILLLVLAGAVEIFRGRTRQPKTSRDCSLFAKYHDPADFHGRESFNAFWFPGYPDCNNAETYLAWRDKHPECNPPAPSCKKCH